MLQGYTFETATALWNEFGCDGQEELALTLPRSRGPSAVLSSLITRASSLSSPAPLSPTSLAPSLSLPSYVSTSTSSSSSSAAAELSSSSTNVNTACTTTSLGSPIATKKSSLKSSSSRPSSAPSSPRTSVSSPNYKLKLSPSLNVPGAPPPSLHHSSSMTIYEGICNFVAHLLRHEQRYGRTLDDAQDLVKTLQLRGIPLELATFRMNAGLAFDVIQEWRAADRARQRVLKAADAELLKLVKQAAMTCDRSLLYAINEEVRPELGFLPYVLQTEVLQYISERDEKGSFILKQNIVQLLYLVVWRTEEPGLTPDLYHNYSVILENCVKMCRSIPLASYTLRDEDADTGVFLPPTTEDEIEMEKSQSRLLGALCHTFHALSEALNISSIEQVRKQLPPLGVICFQCGVAHPTTTFCVFHVPGCKCHRQVTSGCMLNVHNTRSLTCLARSVFGLGAKTLLASASNGALDTQQGGDRPFSQYTWVRDIAAAERSQRHMHMKKLQNELQDIETALHKCLKDPLRPLRV